MTDQLWLNVGCGEFRARPPWTNIDMIESPPGTPHGTFPDRVVAAGEYPFSGVSRIYYGHLLEHMHAAHVFEFLRGWGATLTPDAEVCVVGPDVNKALELFRRNELKRDDLWQRMEAGMHRADVEFWVDYYKRELYDHPGYHRMSCTPERAIALLQLTGYQNIREVSIRSNQLNGWPLVSRAEDQFALLASAPLASTS